MDAYYGDGFERWLAERTTPLAHALEPAGALFDSYGAFVTSIGEPAMTTTAFGRALSDRGFLVAGKDGAGRKRRRGLALRTEASGQSGQSEHSEQSEPFTTRLTLGPGQTVAITVRSVREGVGGQVIEIAVVLNTSEQSEHLRPGSP